MSGPFGFLRPVHAGGFAVAACVLWGCMGGTATDTENGVYVSAQVINASGTPVRNVELNVLELAARVDSAVNDPVGYEKTVNLTTDSTGIAHFYLKKGGTYMTSGKKGDSVVFIDTLRVKVPSAPSVNIDGGLGNPQFLVESPVPATGRVRMYSGLVVDSGQVLLRGTKITATLGDSGTYNLGWLPQSVQKTVVTITYRGRAREERFVKLSAQGNQLTAYAAGVSGSCLDDTTAAVTPAQSRPGSLSSTFDVARTVATACAHRVGAQVTVLEVNASGTVVRTRGTYVIPSPDAPDIWGTPEPDTAAVPLACVEAARNLGEGLTGRATLRLSNQDIVVDDFKNGKACLK